MLFIYSCVMLSMLTFMIQVINYITAAINNHTLTSFSYFLSLEVMLACPEYFHMSENLSLLQSTDTSLHINYQQLFSTSIIQIHL